MEKSIFEEMGGIYEKHGDYLFPCFALPSEKEKLIGIYGQRHLRYLKQCRRVEYINLLTSGRLNNYLVTIDKQARDMFSRIVVQMVEKQGVTEQMKAANQLEWLGRMNNIRTCAMEIVNTKIIYT